MTGFENFLILIGRILMGGLFLWAGFAKVIRWSGSVQYMRSKNLPSSLLPAAIALQVLGGLSVLLGFEARIGCILLIVFVIPSAIKMHDFWNLQDPERTLEKTMFMKDVAVLGGLLVLLATGAGSFGFN